MKQKEKWAQEEALKADDAGKFLSTFEMRNYMAGWLAGFEFAKSAAKRVGFISNPKTRPGEIEFYDVDALGEAEVKSGIRCGVCKKEFTPEKPGQDVCSFECGVKDCEAQFIAPDEVKSDDERADQG